MVLPVYNEEGNIVEMNQRLVAVLMDQPFTSEIIYVDDGSRDTSAALLTTIANSNPLPTVAILFRRNFGQTAAIAAGIDTARGEIIMMMDSDLQNDATDIPMMIAKMQEGYDVVSGWRKERQDVAKRTIPARFANRLIGWATGVRLHDYGCSLKAYRAEVIKNIRLYGEMHRFIPALANAVGARITEVVVKHHPRKAGKSKYGLWRTFKVVLDLMTVKFLTDFRTRPIYLFGGVGTITGGIGLLLLLVALGQALLNGVGFFQSGVTLLAGLFGAVGILSILMGLMTELLTRTYHESQHKPIYHVRQTVTNITESVPLLH